MNFGWGFLFATPFALACVSNGDDSNAKSPGTLGGPCFANNTCNSGLSCTLESGSGVCEQGDATVSDGGGNDAPSDSPNDTTTADVLADSPADVASDACNVSLAASSPCAQCTSGQACCPMSGVCGQTESLCEENCNGQPCWPCSSRAMCSGNQFCCMGNAQVMLTCPPQLQVTNAVTCESSCGSADVVLCANDGDCPTAAPTCVGMKSGTVLNAMIGVCQ